MGTNSSFESRTGKLACKTEDFFNFITDVRNFEQFIPEGTIQNWNATDESCDFHVPPFGSANIILSERTPFSQVIFSGNLLQNNDFTLSVQIVENQVNQTDVRLLLSAGLNPALRMLATGPIEKVLEKLISEMERFKGWNVPFKGSGPL
jgi:hypothetical protein